MSQAATSVSGQDGSRRRLPRVVLGAVAVALALFHLRLLWQRLGDQTVLEPWIAARWLLSGLLLFGLWRLKSAGLRLFSGKRAGVIWLLALLLHVQLPVVPVSAVPDLSGLEPVGWLLALPVSAALGAALALTLRLVLAAFAASPRPRRFPGQGVNTLRLGAPLAGVLPSHLSRPPPLPL